jgi:predicted double-glycine peptidase
MPRISRRKCLAVLLGGSLAVIAGPAAAIDDMRAPLRDPEHVFSKRVCSFQELQRQNVVIQKYDYSCGAAALATILQYYWGDKVTEKEIIIALSRILTPEEIKDRIKKGMALSDLRRVSVEMGYLSSIGTLTFDKLAESKVPLVVPIQVNKYDHFVVFRGVAGGRVYLADPIRGNVRPTVTEFCGQWNKNAILVVVKKGQTPPESSALSIRQDEVDRGEATRHWMNRELPQPLPPPPPLPVMVH